MITSEQYSAYNIGRNHTTLKTKVNVNRDDVDRNFAMHVWQVEHTLNIVLNYLISNKICFNVSNAPLKIIRIIC